MENLINFQAISEYILLFSWLSLTLTQILLMLSQTRHKNLVKGVLLNLVTLWLINVFGVFKLTEVNHLGFMNMINGALSMVIFLKLIEFSKTQKS